MSKFLVSPMEGGEVVECDSLVDAHLAALELRKKGYRNFNVIRSDVVCDFCSQPGVKVIFNAIPGASVVEAWTPEGEIVTHGDGDGLWGACPICEALVLAEDSNGLCRRSVEHFPMTGKLPEELIIISIMGIQAIFFQNWDHKPGTPLMSDEELMSQ